MIRVERDMQMVADRIRVLGHGRSVTERDPADVLKDERVIGRCWWTCISCNGSETVSTLPKGLVEPIQKSR